MRLGLKAGALGKTVIVVNGKFLTKTKLRMIAKRREWPFTVDRVFVGTLEKAPTGAVVFEPEKAELFALNGVARSLKIPNFEPIWRVKTTDSKEKPITRYDIGYVISLALRYGGVKDGKNKKEMVGNDPRGKNN